ARLSTTICWPSDSDTFCATRRASWSGAPPAASATTSRIGRFGKPCARATLGGTVASASSARNRLRSVTIDVLPLVSAVAEYTDDDRARQPPPPDVGHDQ